jgi:hypothetical protein
MFSCVDCLEDHHPIYFYENCEAFPQDFALADFFEMWIKGVDILAHGRTEPVIERLGRNPVTGEVIKFALRRRK